MFVFSFIKQQFGMSINTADFIVNSVKNVILPHSNFQIQNFAIMNRICFLLLIFAISCTGRQEFKKSPVDVLIRDMDSKNSFSIILYDMDVNGSFLKTYQHQYKIITIENEEPKEEITGWYEVSEQFFMTHQNNMGMEIAAKSPDGKLSKTAAPPGYSSYVGNPQYGRWSNHGGGSFWEFYGKYAMMSSLFNMMAYPVHRNYYNDYRSNYSGRKAYYGPKTTSGYTYGTQSAFARKTNANSRWRSKPSNRSFASRSRSRSSSSWSNRTSRSGSRYSGSSGFRSRGGGFGK